METIRTIRLYGKLGAQFGRAHRLAVANTAEAVRALCALLPGFERELMTSRDRGIQYACFLGKRNIGKDELRLSGGAEDIRIAPVLAGAKSKILGALLLGTALIFAGWAVAGLTAFTAIGGAGFAVGGAISSFGVSMLIGGAIQILSPQQQSQSAKDAPANTPSYNFNGPVNTTSQGNPVPLLYGRLIVGSSVISAGILAQDQAYAGSVTERPALVKWYDEMFGGGL